MPSTWMRSGVAVVLGAWRPKEHVDEVPLQARSPVGAPGRAAEVLGPGPARPHQCPALRVARRPHGEG